MQLKLECRTNYYSMLENKDIDFYRQENIVKEEIKRVNLVVSTCAEKCLKDAYDTFEI